MDSKNWIAVGAASALSLGVIAGGAASVANAMPLIENATGLSVPGIAAVTDDGTGADLDFRVSSDSIVSPACPAMTLAPSETMNVSQGIAPCIIGASSATVSFNAVIPFIRSSTTPVAPVCAPPRPRQRARQAPSRLSIVVSSA